MCSLYFQDLRNKLINPIDRRKIMDNFEKAYSAKEIRTTLNIGDSTLRKWCLSLEKHGYLFSRNEQNRRFFVEEDIVVLRHFQTLVQDNNMPLDNAADVISSRFKREAFEDRTPSVIDDNNEEQRSQDRSIEIPDDLIDYLKDHIQKQQDHIQKQEQFNKELLEKLDKQEERIEERLKERDNRLIEVFRTTQENKKEAMELAASKDEEQPKKKGFFSKLFRS